MLNLIVLIVLHCIASSNLLPFSRGVARFVINGHDFALLILCMFGDWEWNISITNYFFQYKKSLSYIRDQLYSTSSLWIFCSTHIIDKTFPFK